MKYWIKQRLNPQTGTYYVACGKMPIKTALRNERTIYGSNIMLRYDTREEYEEKLAKLKADGERVQS